MPCYKNLLPSDIPLRQMRCLEPELGASRCFGSSARIYGQTATPGTGALTASTIATLIFPNKTDFWTIGIGPAMPKDGMMMGPLPAPAWTMPKPIQLNMTGCPGSCSVTDAGLPKTEHTFTISAANKTIAGVVKDASGTTIRQRYDFRFLSIARVRHSRPKRHQRKILS